MMSWRIRELILCALSTMRPQSIAEMYSNQPMLIPKSSDGDFQKADLHAVYAYENVSCGVVEPPICMAGSFSLKLGRLNRLCAAGQSSNRVIVSASELEELQLPPATSAALDNSMVQLGLGTLQTTYYAWLDSI